MPRSEMGEGPITPDEIEPTLRIVRHEVAALQTTIVGNNDLLLEVLKDAAVTRERLARAMELANSVSREFQEFTWDTFGGNPKRPGELGAIRSMQSDINSMRRQQWAILVALLGFVGTGIVDLISRVHGAA